MMQNYNSIFFKRLRKVTQLSAIFFLSAIVLCSCKKKGQLEPDLIEGGINARYTDTATILAGTFPRDSLLTKNTSHSLLGRFNDPVFGLTDAGFYFQIMLSSSDVDFGDEPNLAVDSVILSLDYSNYYGHDDPQSLKVYEMTEAMKVEADYYSNDRFSVDPNAIGNHTITPNLIDSVTVDSVNLAPHARIPLSTTFGQKILNASGSSSLQNNDNFLNFIKGLYIMPDTTVNVSSGQGALIYFDLLSTVSKVTLYYSNTSSGESFSYDFPIESNSIRVTTFDHDYSGTAVEAAFDDGLQNNLKTYVQSAGGVRTKILFPHLSNFTAHASVSVNKAELVIPVDPNYSSPYHPPSDMLVLGIDKDGGSVFLPDVFEGEEYFGGAYDASSNTYTFNITRHIHHLLNEGKKDYGLYVVPSGGAVQGNRAILNSPSHTTSPMKLNLTYTTR